MRKTFVENLPRWKEGVNKGKIDWKQCVGFTIKFVYDEIESEIEIIDYKKKKNKLIIKYKDETLFDVKTDVVLYCRLGKVLGKHTKDFKIEVGQVFKDEKRDLVVVDREYREKVQKDRGKKNEKWYKYTCNKCGWKEGWISENELNRGGGCSCCYGRTSVLGINTIWDTDRWMCDLGLSEEDAKQYTRGSNKKIKVTCPDCGREKKIAIYNMHKYKSICCTCSDKKSYPEKFMVGVLNQLNINFETQLSKSRFDWCDKYKYDFYIPSMNMIIETHGEQHYRECSNFKLSLEEVYENDKIKKELALSNGIKHYVVINCSKSEFDWMTFNVRKQLEYYFDVTNINFDFAEKFALSNTIKEVCEYWSNKEEWETTTTIVQNNKWGIKSPTTIVKYLKKGTKLGWCNYDPKEEIAKARCKVLNFLK